MAFSLSNGTSISSFVGELAQHQNSQLLSLSHHNDGAAGSSDLASARLAAAGNSTRNSDSSNFNSYQGANVTVQSNQNSTPSLIKTRGDSSSYHTQHSQQQSALLQNAAAAGIAYPFLYPSSYLPPGFTTSAAVSQAASAANSAAAAAQYNYSGSGGNGGSSGSMQASQSSNGVSNNRRGKKKAPATQSTNPELRLFFNLRRRDSQLQPSKGGGGQSHIYKPKNPPSLSEWFKRLSNEERVNALSTVCPHLTETFINMFQRIDQSGQSSFARKANPNSSQDQKYFTSNSFLPAYANFGSFYQTSSNDSQSSSGNNCSFDEIFYQRTVGETELLALKNNEKEKLDAELEILKHIRLTDYQSCLDTLTVAEELVTDADYFFKLMSYATNNQAFQNSCQFESKAGVSHSSSMVGGGMISIEQPSWFKPKSFHTFATWILVALEENLWAHYNYDNNTNLGQGSAKTNDLSALFREKSDIGAQDVDLLQLAQFWRDTNEKDKKVLIDQFKGSVVKEAEQEYNQSHSTSGHHSKTHKVVHSKQMHYSLHIREKPEKQVFQEQVDQELKWLVDFSLRQGLEQELLTSLMYTTFEKANQRQVNINRKFLDLIKKKFKDDLMENLLQEEYQNVKIAKSFKKKKKKNATANNSNNQQSTQQQQSNMEKINQSSGEINTAINSDTFTDDQSQVKLSKPKKKKVKQNSNQQSHNLDKNMSSEEKVASELIGNSLAVVSLPKKKKNNSSKIKHHPTSTAKDINSCDEQQPQIEVDNLEKEDTLESDNKNSSIDTKSSSNHFEIATAHQSNNSTSNSAVTLKSQNQIIESSLSKDKNELKSSSGIFDKQALDLNHSFRQRSTNEGPYSKNYKQQSKVESKNYQILQNSQNYQDVQQYNSQNNNKEERKYNNSSNQYVQSKIFSEDNTKRHDNSKYRPVALVNYEQENESIINSYILELTNNLINEVCKKLEAESPVRGSIDGGKCSNKQKLNTLLCQKLAPENIQIEELPQIQKNNKTKQYYNGAAGKNNARKESGQIKKNMYNQNTQQEDKSFRKKSFNSKKYIKDEKKFSEDIADQATNQAHFTAILNNGQIEENSQQNQTRKSSNAESYKSGNQHHHRKGFGINLKGNEEVSNNHQRQSNNQSAQSKQQYPQSTGEKGSLGWAKGIAKQPDTEKKKNHNQRGVVSDFKIEDPQLAKSQQSKPNKDTTNNSEVLNKKKRNKKKSKMTDTDIMNQFMKTLHSHNEEEQLKQQLSNDQAKKRPQDSKANFSNNKQPQRQMKILQKEKSESVVIDEPLKSEQPIEEISNNEEYKPKPKPYKQRYSQRPPQGSQIIQSNTTEQVQYSQKKSFDDHKATAVTEDSTPITIAESDDSQTKSQTIPLSDIQQIYQVKGQSNSFKQTGNRQNTQINQKQKEVTLNQTILVDHVQVNESENSSKADCISDKSSGSNLQQNLNSKIQGENSQNNAFRHLNFQSTTANECDNTSFTELTCTTTSVVDTSIETNIYNGTISNTLQPQKYQSYQNTPSKSLNTNSKTFVKQNHNINNAMASSTTHPFTFHQNEQEQSSTNYRTPPQLAKKQNSQQNYSHHGGHYRKAHHNNAQQHSTYGQVHHQEAVQSGVQGYNQSHIGGVNTKSNSRNSTQYRQVNRVPTQVLQHNGQITMTSAMMQVPSLPQSNIYMQPMNISQSMQEQQQYLQSFMNPENNNIFYQDQQQQQQQQMMMNQFTQQPMADHYVQKPHDQIFSYVEKNPMILQQPRPCYSPNHHQYQLNQFMIPGAPIQGSGQEHMLMPNPFNYPQAQRMSSMGSGMPMTQTPYFDQSQDLIFQIFNSIKSNHSMSPIPQMMSPTPLLDFQMSQSSDLSFGCGTQRMDSAIYNPQEAYFTELLDAQISEHIKLIEDNINIMKPERDYVYDKLSETTKQVFAGQNPYLELFGSLITRLALESSDMDLAVTGLRIDDRYLMIGELNKLADALQDWKCLESFKSIETASIPVIKLKVDLVKLRENEMPQLIEGDFESRPIPENQRFLSVDITFDDSPVNETISGQNLTAQDLLGLSNSTKTHLGLQSCALVQYYIQNYKHLREVAILLKKFLAIHSYNSPYYGGISSYSTVILIVAYMNYFNMKGEISELTPSRLLMGFLDFYGNYFNPGSMGISVYDDGSFFQLNSLLDSNFVILDPLNLQNNTTRNSYHTKEILLKFQCAFNNLKRTANVIKAQTQRFFHFERATPQQPSTASDAYHQQQQLPQQPSSDSNAFVNHETSNNQYVQNANFGGLLNAMSAPMGTVNFDNSGCIPITSQKNLEEQDAYAARNDQALDYNDAQRNIDQIQSQINLLETFFAQDPQQVADLSISPSSQTDPRITLINQD